MTHYTIKQTLATRGANGLLSNILSTSQKGVYGTEVEAVMTITRHLNDTYRIYGYNAEDDHWWARVGHNEDIGVRYKIIKVDR